MNNTAELPQHIPGPQITADWTERTIRFDLPDAEPVWCDAENALVLPVNGEVCISTQAIVEPKTWAYTVDVLVRARPLTKAGTVHATRHHVLLVNEDFERKLLSDLGIRPQAEANAEQRAAEGF